MGVSVDRGGAGAGAGGVTVTSRHKSFHRQDSTKAVLVDAIRSYPGWHYEDLDGAIDGIVWHLSGKLFPVELKGPKTKLTRRQDWLIMRGFPLRILRTVEDVRILLTAEPL